jgi:hypothetical protein
MKVAAIAAAGMVAVAEVCACQLSITVGPEEQQMDGTRKTITVRIKYTLEKRASYSYVRRKVIPGLPDLSYSA